MTALVRSMAFSVVIATVAGCGERAVDHRLPVAGDRIVAEITPALPWKARQFAQLCVRFKILDAEGNERGYLKETEVSPETVPRTEITLLHDKGKSSTRTLAMSADC